MLKKIKCIALLAVCILLQSCATSTPPSNDLALIACPKLTPPIDDSFEQTTLKLIEIVGIYKKCRAVVIK